MKKRPSAKAPVPRVPRGRVLRPTPVVLDDAALVPAARAVKPPPNQFTHEVLQSQPFYYDEVSAKPDGTLSAGTLVVLMVHDGGPKCRVVDGQGLYVVTAYKGLRRLSG